MPRIARSLSTLFTACAATALCASPAHATNYVFTEAGFTDGATLSGTFTATDANGSGAIEYNSGDPTQQDVTAFSATFSGNSLISAFQLDFQDLSGCTTILRAYTYIQASLSYLEALLRTVLVLTS